MIKLVIFDLDGTLVDSLGDVTAAINVVLNSYKAPPITSQKMQGFFGQGIEVLLSSLLQEYPHITHQDALEKFRMYYTQNTTHKSQLYTGLETLLQTLEDAHISQTVLTNKQEHPARKLLTELGAIRYFDPVAGPDTYDVHKPDPRGLQAILDYHQCPPTQAIMVGDSEIDIL